MLGAGALPKAPPLRLNPKPVAVSASHMLNRQGSQSSCKCQTLGSPSAKPGVYLMAINMMYGLHRVDLRAYHPRSSATVDTQSRLWHTRA